MLICTFYVNPFIYIIVIFFSDTLEERETYEQKLARIDISNSLVGNYTVTYTYDGSETTTSDISIGQTFNVVDQVDLCENETYIFGSQTLTADDAGLNTEVFQSVTGCDSTVVLTVSVLSNSFSETVSICENETYTFGSQMLTANDAGLNTEIFPNAMANGCDSIVNLTLEVKTNSFSEDVVICEGDTYVFGSQTLTANDIGLHTEIFPNAMVNGCDSIVNLNLEVQNIDISVSFESTGSTFSFMSNQNGATYQWLDCNNGSSMTVDSVEQTIQFVDEVNANYAVEVTLNGCVDTSDCYNVAFFGIENEKW